METNFTCSVNALGFGDEQLEKSRDDATHPTKHIYTPAAAYF